MTDSDDFHKWILRIFGSVEAYEKSLPARSWVKGANGWVSYPR